MQQSGLHGQDGHPPGKVGGILKVITENEKSPGKYVLVCGALLCVMYNLSVTVIKVHERLVVIFISGYHTHNGYDTFWVHRCSLNYVEQSVNLMEAGEWPS